MKLLNWNQIIGQNRRNKYGANTHKQKEMQEIGGYLKSIKPITEYPIQMIFTWHIKNVNSDLDNKSVKNILDQMQKEGILENDNIKHIQKITHIAVKDKDEYVELEIKKMEV